MPTTAHIHAVCEGGMRVTAGDGEHSVTMDYPLPGDEAAPAGLTPLRTLLASLAACGGSTVAHLLRKMRQPLEGLEVEATASRRDEHPTVYTSIAMEFIVHGGDVEPAAVEKALGIADEQLCPVWAMLKDGTTITTSYRIVAD